MKTISTINWDKIDDNIPEGELLKTAICIIGYLYFKDKNPSLIFEVIKDIKLHPFVNESLQETMERIITKYKSTNN